MKYLVENGADVNAGALMYASENGHFEIVKYLIANGANIDSTYSANTEIQSFLKLQLNFIDFAKQGNLEKVKECIANGADVNAKKYYGKTALKYASENGHFEIIKYLIANGADVNANNNYGETALNLAKTDEIKAYLEQAIKQKEFNDFISFVKQGDLEKIRECLSNGVNINAVDSDGKTALMWACQKGHFEVAITLISSGTDINAKDKNGKTAINYSAESGNVELMKLLLAQGADTGAKG